MLSMLYLRLTIKLKVGWCRRKVTGSSHLKRKVRKVDLSTLVNIQRVFFSTCNFIFLLFSDLYLVFYLLLHSVPH